jgi:hypothetical protein
MNVKTILDMAYVLESLAKLQLAFPDLEFFIGNSVANRELWDEDD